MLRRLPAILLCLACAAPAGAAEVHLAVAASMTDVAKELAAAYAKMDPEVTFLPNFGGSGALAKQIAAGAPADLFISANAQWMDYLAGAGAVVPQTVRAFAGNTLVFVGPPGTKAAALTDLPGLGRIAVGSPKSVPAGQYAQEALEKAGVWAQLAAAGKLVLTDDVRQALLYADRGEIDGAFVYRTDALRAKEARILFPVPADLHAPVICPVALTPAGTTNRAALAFYDYLRSPAAREILEKYGFLVQ